MEFTAQINADFLKGEIVGNKDEIVNDISRIEEGRKGTLAFLANPKYIKYIYTTKASIVLVNRSLELEHEVNSTLIRVDDAYSAFASLLNLYTSQLPQKKGIEPDCFISKSATIGENCYVGTFAYVGDNVKVGDNSKIYPQVYLGDNVTVGSNTTLYPGVKIYKDCKIGSGCIIHAGTVIGSDGFGFAPEGDTYQKIPQIGNVIIEDDVEIGSNVSIDRATIGSTILRKGVKLDNLIQIAHNVEIGANTAIAAQTGIAGSSKVGANCIIAAQVGIAGHLTITNKVVLGAKSGLNHNLVNEGEILLGAPADLIGNTRKSMILYKRLPELYGRIIDLEKELKKIQEESKK
jgi:UDP-3-O-[3-hydroxymyristoyl] glucosamine N-acyltransferase